MVQLPVLQNLVYIKVEVLHGDFLPNAKLNHGSLEAAGGSTTGQGEGAEAAQAASVTEPVKLWPHFSTTRAESRWVQRLVRQLSPFRRCRIRIYNADWNLCSLGKDRRYLFFTINAKGRIPGLPCVSITKHNLIVVPSVNLSVGCLIRKNPFYSAYVAQLVEALIECKQPTYGYGFGGYAEVMVQSKADEYQHERNDDAAQESETSPCAEPYIRVAASQVIRISLFAQRVAKQKVQWDSRKTKG